MTANQGGSEFECASDGSFEPLQCQPIAGNLLNCVCVNPSNGLTITGTEITVADRDDAPDCDRLGECVFALICALYLRGVYTKECIFRCSWLYHFAW